MKTFAHERPFERTVRLFGEEGAARIAAARTIVVGTGGVGGWCAEALVRTGMGRVTLVDPDSVCESNINRQTMATSETVGQPKAEALRARLLAVNPAADVIAVAERYSAETAGRFDFAEYDFVVDAIDSVRDKAALARRALASPEVKFFSSMGAARRTDPLRVRVSDFWKVHGDGLARALRAEFRRNGMPPRPFQCVWSDELPAEASLPGGTAMHVTAVFGLVLAHLVIREAAAGSGA